MEKEEIYDILKPILDQNNEIEHFYFGILDDSDTCVFKAKIATGNEFQVEMPVPIMNYLLKEWGFKRYFLAHNHSSGISNPSEKDIRATIWLNELFLKDGFKLEGHLIIGDSLGLIGGF